MPFVLHLGCIVVSCTASFLSAVLWVCVCSFFIQVFSLYFSFLVLDGGVDGAGCRVVRCGMVRPNAF